MIDKDSVVLDASAVLALLHREPGAEVVESNLANAMISAVNVAEVATRLADRGMSDADIRDVVVALGMTVVSFDDGSAYAAASLRPKTRNFGLSLGDRACLSLASHLSLPALTADRMWADVEVGVEVRQIRE